MTTSIYIDPSAATNGTGTAASPYNTWTGVPVGAGYQYFQKRGTSWTGVFPTLSAGISSVTLNRVSSYYNADGSDDTTQPLPILNLGDSALTVPSYTKVTNMDVRNNRASVAAYTPAILINGSGSEVSSNNVTTNLAGIGVADFSNVTISNNTITAATASGSTLMQAVYVNNTTAQSTIAITGNTIKLGTAGTSVRGIHCVTNGGPVLTGLSVKNNTISTVDGSTITAATHYGISITYAASPELSGNTVPGLYYGMNISSGCTSPWVHNNTCNGNQTGINLGGVSTSHTVEWNTCRHNALSGVVVDTTSDGGTIRFNDCSLNTTGISSGAPRSAIFGNTCYKNSSAGINLTSGSGDDTGGRVVTSNFLILNNTAAGTFANIACNGVKGTRTLISNNLFVGGIGGVWESNTCTNIEKSNNVFKDQTKFAIAALPSYVRNSIGTYFDFQGVMRTADIGVARTTNYNPSSLSSGYTNLYEAAATNLLLHPENFSNTVWTKSNSTVTANAAVAPDGTLRANAIFENTVNNFHYVYQSVTVGAGLYTLSVYVKAGSRNRVRLSPDGVAYADFNLGTSTVTQSGTTAATITAVANGWFRCTISANLTAGTKTAQIIMLDGTGTPSYAGVATNNIYVWGAQLEAGSAATSYIPSATAFSSRASQKSYYNQLGVLSYAGNDQPAYDYDPATLRYENMLSYSEDFTAGSVWATDAASRTANAATAPDGTLTADKLFEQVATTTHDVYQPISGTANIPLTFSCYVKAAGRTKVRLGLATSSFGNGGVAYFDLSTGTLTSASNAGAAVGTSGSITAVGNGWYRCSVTAAPTITGTWFPSVGLLDSTGTVSYTGDGSSGVYLWGAQLNSGSTALEYKRTDANPVPKTYMEKGLSVEGAGTNLIPYSQTFDSNWSLYQSTVIRNAAIAPDGSFMAAKLMNNGAGEQSLKGPVFSFASGTTYTTSVYAKAGEQTTFQGTISSTLSSAGGLTAVFNLANGTIGSVSGGLTAAIQSVGNGWYRCSWTFACTNSTSTNAVWVNMAMNTADTTKGMYFWGAQLETGSAVTTYMPSSLSFTSRSSTGTYFDLNGTMQTAAANVARYTYDPGNLSTQPWLMLEPAATNSLFYSEQLDNAVWSKTAATVTANSATAPDGSSSADVISFNVGGTYPNSYLLQSPTGLPAGTYTLSAYVNTATQCLFIGGAVTVTSQSFKAIPIGNGWYRQIITATTSTAMTQFIFGPPGNTTAAVSVAVWGAQLETGSVATSYIPTTNVTVTRSADSYGSTAGNRSVDVVTSSPATRAADTPSVRNNIYKPGIPINVGDLTLDGNNAPAPVSISVASYNGDRSVDPLLDANYAPTAGSPLLDTSWRDGIRFMTVPMAVSDA